MPSNTLDSSKQSWQALEAHYASLFNDSKLMRFFAPGRVNLIGEYTDFNGGLVLPCAIQLGTYLIIQENTSNSVSFNSMNCPETISIPIEELKKLSISHSDYAWANYPIGILKEFSNHLKTGLDFYFSGNIPLGSGLSSSASIEMVTAFALNTLCNTQHSLTDLALLCQDAENQFIGLQCGIMDMYSIAHGKSGCAMMINCEQCTHSNISLNMEDLAWLIINSKKSRQLSESKYNERNQECQKALAILNKTRQLNNLCQLPFSELAQAKQEITDAGIYKRLHHVVSEHQRVIDCQHAMQNSDWNKVAELMNASHQSLSEDFEVSGETLNTLVTISQQTDGVLAARMTGAGFGGCTINLIKKDKLDSIIDNIKSLYGSASHLNAEFYIAEASQGVHQYLRELDFEDQDSGDQEHA
jgi:galactokinase